MSRPRPFLGSYAQCSLTVTSAASVLILLYFHITSAMGCSVPVFRYALERWTPAPYELIILHRGPLVESEKALISRLPGIALSNALPVNLIVRTIDLASAPAAVQLEYSQRQNLPPLPAMLLRTPSPLPQQHELWSGPLTEHKISLLIDSPMRRRLVQRLVKGDSATWLLLESGDRAQDDTAARVLSTQLERLQKTLQVPKLDPGVAPNAGSPQEQVQVAFSVLRLARSDSAEEIFIRMLLGSEEDLGQLQSPLAFPIFGRGRILYALAGPGIDAENIAEACTFLIGPCSCVVKDENPGFDLLLSSPWDSLVRIADTAAQPAPEVVGLTSLVPASTPAQEKSAPSISGSRSNVPCLASLEPSTFAPSLVLRRLVFLFILFGGVVLIASIRVWLRGKRQREST